MVVDIVRLLPAWLLVGVALGLLATGGVAATFYAADRLSPTRDRSSSGPRVDGAARRRMEVRDYLRSIGERVREGASVADVRVPFYLPEREVAVTFDAHDYFRLREAGVSAVLAEHELPGHSLGRRLPFDVPEPEPRARRTPDPVAAAFDELGVSRTADAAAVKRAYRERVKEVHPDQGGDEATFRRVREAYATASAHVEAGDSIDSVPEPREAR
ncbi:J domain-containing protein [Haloparvum sedimenti]|uniref:J domain-containing protein n=1 Tax=Haloparvum sedimenti TaxID=1678448 RepID=UPI00071E744D|nr:J domain-containing protein [Haloparvum sedimenti]